jgi:hypothetical protein
MTPTAFLLCGALAREVIAIAHRHSWDVALHGVSAVEHMRPVRIGPLVERKLRELIPQFQRIIVVYGDCGTGGALDEVLQAYNVPRIAGPHCYEMYGGAAHDALMAEQLGTFFLTDFLLRGFEGMVWNGLGLDRFPELREQYFGNYTRLVYLVQTQNDDLLRRAYAISQKMNLPLEIRRTGFGELETRLVNLMAEIDDEKYRPVMREEKIFDDKDFVPNSVLAQHSRPGARRRTARPRQRAALPALPGSD